MVSITKRTGWLPSAGTLPSSGAPILMPAKSSSRILKTTQISARSTSVRIGKPAPASSPGCSTTLSTSAASGDLRTSSIAAASTSATPPAACRATASAAQPFLRPRAAERGVVLRFGRERGSERGLVVRLRLVITLQRDQAFPWSAFSGGRSCRPVRRRRRPCPTSPWQPGHLRSAHRPRPNRALHRQRPAQRRPARAWRAPPGCRA